MTKEEAIQHASMKYNVQAVAVEHPNGYRGVDYVKCQLSLPNGMGAYCETWEECLEALGISVEIGLELGGKIADLVIN